MAVSVKTLDFADIKSAVSVQFDKMKQYPLFRVDVTGEELWDTYLKSFPAGSNPIFRERTEHDCSCCRHFIRDIGNVVALTDDGYMTIWDGQPESSDYAAVCQALSELVNSRDISEPFLFDTKKVGVDKNFEQLPDGVRTWGHFSLDLNPALVKKRDQIPTLIGEYKSSYTVFFRALTEIEMDATDTYLELVSQNSLYRGEEHKPLVESFRSCKLDFDGVDSNTKKNHFVWKKVLNVSPSLTRIRNTVVGTLLTDISEGVDLERAVASYESKVAPTNYKRTTAPITESMVKKAKAEIEELGLSSALERRFAVLEDVSINNVIFADRQAARAMTGDVFDDLAGDVGSRVSNKKKLDKVEEISIEKFISDVVPHVDSIELLVENKHQGNFVSLVSPVGMDSGRLFKWDNLFSWTYAGEVADSIKERVKKAGGNVTGDLCCRLAWYNYDDLDFHMKEPDGTHIYFGNKRSRSTGGQLDVDMNAGVGESREPVENIFYRSKASMKEGVYELIVNQFNRRESDNDGFEVEIDFMGEVYSFATDRSPSLRRDVVVAKMEYSHKDGLKVEGMDSKRVSKTVWNIPTETFRRVSTVMLSPNHWDDKAVGNKHYFFMLDGCVNDGAARGFYNEFLTPELEKHRKVMEIVGSKLKMVPADYQLSGLGYSSTKKDSVVCKVKGAFTRTLKINF